MNYNTSVTAGPPVTLGGLLAPPKNINADVYDGLAQKNSVALERQAQMANADHVQQARSSQQQLAQRGLQQMAQQQQNANSLADSRQNMQSSYLN